MTKGRATTATEAAVRRVAEDAVRAGSMKYGQDAARQWGDGFTMPAAVIAQDEADFARLGYDLTALADERKAKLSDGRLSAARVDTLSPGNPERERARELATRGMPVVVDEHFVFNGDKEWPRMRTDYVDVHSAVGKSFYASFVATGLAIILTVATVTTMLKDYHLSVAGHALKDGKPGGRPLTDCTTGRTRTASVLNSDSAKAQSEELWGKISHPTIAMLVMMVLTMQQRPEHAGGKGLSLWATDIASAYTKLFFKSSDVKYMAVELVGGLVLFFLAGIFGWGSTPACFAVISRLLLYEFRLALSGEVEIYVDDASGCCPTVDVAENLREVDEIVCRVLGPGALEHSKTRHGRRLDLIGYTLDLDSQRVSIASKNVLRAILGCGARYRIQQLQCW